MNLPPPARAQWRYSILKLMGFEERNLNYICSLVPVPKQPQQQAGSNTDGSADPQAVRVAIFSWYAKHRGVLGVSIARVVDKDKTLL